MNYAYPGFFSQASARHFGDDFTNGSIFQPRFQNEAGLLNLANFAANHSPLRDTNSLGSIDIRPNTRTLSANFKAQALTQT